MGLQGSRRRVTCSWAFSEVGHQEPHPAQAMLVAAEIRRTAWRLREQGDRGGPNAFDALLRHPFRTAVLSTGQTTEIIQPPRRWGASESQIIHHGPAAEGMRCGTGWRCWATGHPTSSLERLHARFLARPTPRSRSSDDDLHA